MDEIKVFGDLNLNKIVNPETDTWKNELQSDERQVGFIAQEVEEQLPEVVDNGGGDTKGIAYGKVTALLVNAIKEQQTIIEDLKSRIETLEG